MRNGFLGCSAVTAAALWAMPASAINVFSGLTDTGVGASVTELSGSDTSADDPGAALIGGGTITTSTASTTATVSGSSEATADALLDVSTLGFIDVEAFVTSEFTNMVGGTYTTNGTAEFELVFTVDVDTPYETIGSYGVTPGQSSWNLRLDGPGGFFDGSATNAVAAGPFEYVGTLLAGETYALRGSVTFQDFAQGEQGNQALETNFIDLSLAIPEPGMGLALAGLAGLVGLRRRVA